MFRIRVFLLFLIAWAALPAVAFATTGGEDPAAPVFDSGDHVLVLSPWVVKIIVGSLLPFVVAAITRYQGREVVKGLASIVVAAVAAMITRAITVDEQAVFDRALIVDTFLTALASLFAYLTVWRNVGGQASGGINARVLPEVGLG